MAIKPLQNYKSTGSFYLTISEALKEDSVSLTIRSADGAVVSGPTMRSHPHSQTDPGGITGRYAVVRLMLMLLLTNGYLLTQSALGVQPLRPLSV